MFHIKHHSSRLFNILTIIILAGLCMLLGELTKIDFHKMELPKNKPEFAATGFEASLYSPQGALLYRVNAAAGNQFPDSNRILMKSIILQSYSESDTSLREQITSNDGWLDTKSSLGFLGESVVLTLSNPDPKQVVHVYTRNVDLNAKKKTATSSEPLRAVQNKSILTGIGFFVDYESKILIVESNVKVIYQK